MDNLIRHTIKETDNRIAIMAEHIQKIILGDNTITEKSNELIVEIITKDCNNIQDLLKVRTILLKY